MRLHTETWRRLAAGLLAAALTGGLACASTPEARGADVEARSPDHFIITERARPGAAVRADFEEALARLDAGETETGIALLRDVTEAAPSFTAARVNLAIAYREKGRLDEARAELDRALAASPGHPVALNELGMTHRRAGRLDEARSAYESALAAHPGFHFALRNLGILCDLYLADPPCALEYYERYVAAAPDDVEVTRWIADLRTRSGR